MEFISKELIANELKRRIDFCNKIADASAELNLHNSLEANELLIRQYENLLSFLDTLKVKEVDLEKEVANWWNGHYADIKKGYTFEGYNGHYMQNSTVISLAKHFFELGIQKAQKGE